MQIISLWPATEPGSTLARFDIEVVDGLRLCGLRLTQNDRGQYRTVPPRMGTRRSVSFLPDVATEITGAAVARLQELKLNASA
jgi:hypothetical protein